MMSHLGDVALSVAVAGLNGLRALMRFMKGLANTAVTVTATSKPDVAKYSNSIKQIGNRVLVRKHCAQAVAA